MSNPALSPRLPAAVYGGRTVTVETRYTAAVRTTITLPAPLTWADVAHYRVKYGTLFLTLKDGSELPFELNYIDLADIEIKFPDETRILDPDTGARLPGTEV